MFKLALVFEIHLAFRKDTNEIKPGSNWKMMDKQPAEYTNTVYLGVNSSYRLLIQQYNPFLFVQGFIQVIYFEIVEPLIYLQVLHHLDDLRDGKNFPMVEQALQETKRILRHGGMLIISTVLAPNIRESVWYLQLLPRVKQILANSQMSFVQYMDIFDKYGYLCVAAINLLTTKEANICNNHFDPDNLLDEDWRQASNFFGMATDLEIQEMELAIIEMKHNGSLKTFVRDNDHTHERGFVTMFACVLK